jgi:hypothetical protein
MPQRKQSINPKPEFADAAEKVKTLQAAGFD